MLNVAQDFVQLQNRASLASCEQAKNAHEQQSCSGRFRNRSLSKLNVGDADIVRRSAKTRQVDVDRERVSKDAAGGKRASRAAADRLRTCRRPNRSSTFVYDLHPGNHLIATKGSQVKSNNANLETRISNQFDAKSVREVQVVKKDKRQIAVASGPNARLAGVGADVVDFDVGR